MRWCFWQCLKAGWLHAEFVHTPAQVPLSKFCDGAEATVAWLSWVHSAQMHRCFISKGVSFAEDVWDVVYLLGWLFLSSCACFDHRGVMGAIRTAHALLSFPFPLDCQIDGLALACLGRSFWSTAVEEHKIREIKRGSRKLLKKETKLKAWAYRNMTDKSIFLFWPAKWRTALDMKKIIMITFLCVSLLIFLIKPY